MKLSACITINSREISVLDTVFASMRGQDYDEFIIVLDRVDPALADYCKTYWIHDTRVKFVEVAGAAGWRSPVKAWNAGYAAVTGDHLYCFSSETVQAAGNLAKARAILADTPCVLFGKAECSCGPSGTEVNWGGTAPGNLLCDSYHPRPLGFIWAAPMANVRQIGGWDEAFDAGFWYDESDFFVRLWRTNLPFIFDDTISGTHLHHERPELTQTGIRTNAAYLVSKHGTLDPWSNTPRISSHLPPRTTWYHI